MNNGTAQSTTTYDNLLSRLRQAFAPSNEHESFLVEQMARARWKLSQIQRLESEAFENPNDRTLATLQRYASAAERSYFKAHDEFLRARQMQNEAKSAARAAAAPQPAAQKQNEPKKLNPPKFYTAPGENLALRL